MITNANTRFEDWEAEQMKDPEFRAAVEELEPAYQAVCLEYSKNEMKECHKELEALRKKVTDMKEWIAWRDKLLKEAFEQIGVEWHSMLLLPAVGYQRFVHECKKAATKSDEQITEDNAK